MPIPDHDIAVLDGYPIINREYINHTLGEIAFRLAAALGWDVIGDIHQMTTAKLTVKINSQTLLQALEEIAQLASVQMRKGDAPRTIEMGVFEESTGWPRPIKYAQIDISSQE